MGQRARPATRPMVKCVLPLGLALLAGCAVAPPNPPEAVPVTVKVPVYEPVYCSPPKLERPVLPVGALTPGTGPADTMRAYAATVVILKGAVNERDEVIAGCEKPGGSGSVEPAVPEDANGRSNAVASEEHKGVSGWSRMFSLLRDAEGEVIRRHKKIL